jgi:hypothetical protein
MGSHGILSSLELLETGGNILPQTLILSFVILSKVKSGNESLLIVKEIVKVVFRSLLLLVLL